MKKLKPSVNFLLAIALVLGSTALPVIALYFGDFGLLNGVQQESSDYIFKVDQEPYSIAEKLNLIMRMDYADENVAVVDQKLKDTSNWTNGVLQSATETALQSVLQPLGMHMGTPVISDESMQYIIADSAKPSLYVRCWTLVGSTDNCDFEMIIDVDTGIIYTLGLWNNSFLVDSQAVFQQVMLDQFDGTAYQVSENLVILYEDKGEVVWECTAYDKYGLTWAPSDVYLNENAAMDAYKS